MNKAEERALEAYPPRMMWRGSKEYDDNKGEREIYLKGYLQAEKDNALTWEDIKMIYRLVGVVADDLGIKAINTNIYEEVLKRFKERKEVKGKG